MNLIVNNDKLPIVFILKTVTVGFGIGACILFSIIIIGAYFSFSFTNPSMIPRLSLNILIIPVVAFIQGLFFSLIIALGLSVYSKFKIINVKLSNE